MRYWLMKSEPEAYGIDDLARDKVTAWWGVRNYQARNFMRDQMKPGDRAFFYHSNCKEPGIVGIAEVSRAAYPDETQFDRKSRFFDAKATRENPRWLNVEVKFLKKTRPVPLATLRAQPQLAALRVLATGNRLSITPVDPTHWKFIVERLMGEKAR